MFLFNLPPKERVAKARIKLIREKPFFGYILMQMRFKPKKKGTMSVSKRGTIMFNENYVKLLKDNEIVSDVAHELLHWILEHHKRWEQLRRSSGLEAEDHRIYNYAADAVINTALILNGFDLFYRELDMGEMKLRYGSIIPQFKNCRWVTTVRDANGKEYLIMDTDKKSADEVFWELKNAGFTPPPCENDDSEFDDDDGDSESDSKGEGGCEGIGSSSNDECGGTDAKNIAEILSEAYQYAKMQGNAPAGLDRYITESLKPKINWLDELRRLMLPMIPYDYSYYKPSKKSPPDVVLPGVTKGEYLEVVMGVDTSGSVTQKELSEFKGFLEWLAKNFMCFRITLACCDAELQEEKELCKFIDIKQIESMKGGGGTDFRPVFELAEKKRARVLIFLTDGFGEFPEKPPRFTTVWAVTENGAPDSYFPFGKVLRIKSE